MVESRHENMLKHHNDIIYVCVHAFALCMTTKIMILVLGEVNF